MFGKNIAVLSHLHNLYEKSFTAKSHCVFLDPYIQVDRQSSEKKIGAYQKVVNRKVKIYVCNAKTNLQTTDTDKIIKLIL